MAFINLDTARLARTAGYNEISSAVWFSDPEKLGEMAFSDHAMRCNHNAWVTETNRKFPSYSAPTQDTLAKWLRTDHRIHVLPHIFDIDNSKKYVVSIISPRKSEASSCEDLTPNELQSASFDKYEDAMEAGIQFALNLVAERIDKSKMYLV